MDVDFFPDVEIVDFLEVVEEFGVDVDDVVVDIESVKIMNKLYYFCKLKLNFCNCLKFTRVNWMFYKVIYKTMSSVNTITNLSIQCYQKLAGFWGGPEGIIVYFLEVIGEFGVDVDAEVFVVVSVKLMVNKRCFGRLAISYVIYYKNAK